MTELGEATPPALVVGATLLVGALAAGFVRLPEKFAAAVTVFGGGVLLAAVAFELVPGADRAAGSLTTAVAIVVGTLLYVAADWLVERGKDVDFPGSAEAEVARGEKIAAALVVDGVPESIALGLTLASEEIPLALLAGIVLANVAEGYGAAHPMITGGRRRAVAVAMLGVIGLVLAVTVVVGRVLTGLPPSVVGAGQAVAAGAMVGTVVDAIIPYAFGEVSRTAGVIAVLGFVTGFLLE